MAINVRLPSGFSSTAETVSVNAKTMKEVFEAVELSHPGFRAYVYDSYGRVRRSLSIFVNGLSFRDLEVALPDGASVEFHYAAAGG
jgi:hypothetical protein